MSLAMTGFINKIKRLIREQRGAVALTVAFLLVGGGGLVAGAVDVGMLYTARAELQNAADATALAGAATMVGYNDSGQVVSQWEDGVAAAKQVASSNKALNVSLNLLDQDITMGYWDSATKDFDPWRTGPSANPGDLTAFRVTLRRDQVANSPVSTIFAGIVGIDQVNIRATSTAFLGYVGEVPGDTVDLPVAVKEEVLTDPNGPRCNTWIKFHSEQDESAEWTTFFTFPANDPNVRDYVDGSLTTPPLKVGDYINTINGVLSTNTFRALERRFNENKVNGKWLVTLPVIRENGRGWGWGGGGGGQGQTTKEVVGFVQYVITDVCALPCKKMIGYMVCDNTIAGSSAGGGNFGTRASNPQLVQ